jgi:hypothetical protein
MTNGLTKFDGSPLDTSLIAALQHFGLDSMTVVEKQSMRALIRRGHPFTVAEETAILDYCEQDVHALELLLPMILPHISLPHAIFRGRYTKAVARMEFSGQPVDLPTLDRLNAHWEELKLRIASDVEGQYQYGVYQGTHWSDRRFENLLTHLGILAEWPHVRRKDGTYSEHLSLDDDDTFKEMAARYPVLAPLRELRSILVRLRTLDLPIGVDGRNRCSLAPFRSVTGRNYPPVSEFIFGKPTWVRSLVRPEKDRAIAYIDWSSAEFGIAAALSDDPRMKEAYLTGDVYMAFAIMAGAAPPGATKRTHAAIRELYKTVVLGVQYLQTEFGLAKSLGISLWRAQELLDLHRRVFVRYWQWSEWMAQTATFSRQIETVFGWRMQLTSWTKPRTVSNFPMQANGAELLRWACCFATEEGIEVHAPVQDALLVGGQVDEIEDVVAVTKAAMAKACDLVLHGFILRSDVKIVRFPDRYVDERGAAMWDRIVRLLSEAEVKCLEGEECRAGAELIA